MPLNLGGARVIEKFLGDFIQENAPRCEGCNVPLHFARGIYSSAYGGTVWYWYCEKCGWYFRHTAVGDPPQRRIEKISARTKSDLEDCISADTLYGVEQRPRTG